MEDKDLYWLAGILEGEGWFGCNKRKYKVKSGEEKIYLDPVVNLQMTDKDIIERAATLIGGSVRTYQSKRTNSKILYRVSVNGRKKAIPLMERLLPIMGERRQNKIRSILSV